MGQEAEDSKATLKRLQVIPGVGPSIAQDLVDLGIRRVQDLKGRSPEELYETHCDRVGYSVDRCLLYVFRCAVYFASAKRHDPEKLKWWHWKDGGGTAGKTRTGHSGKR